MNLILTPAHYGKLHARYVDSLIETERAMPDTRHLFVIGESLVQRARNDLFRMAYEIPEVDQILWIDEDQVWNPTQAAKILADERDFVTGLVKQKMVDGKFCIREPNEKDFTVKSCGMGFCKMRRPVMEQLWKKSIEYKDGEKKARMVFEVGIDRFGELFSEDISVARKWKGKIYYDPEIVVGHIGEIIF